MKQLPRIFGTLIVASSLAATAGAQQQAQARALALDDALRIASAQSEAIRIAQAGVMRAQGSQLQARSQYLPQVNGSLTYTRTLASPFSALQSGPAPVPPAGVPPAPPHDSTTYYQPCLRYLAPTGASEADKLLGLETYARCSSSGSGGIDFQKVGFGAKNSYQLGVAGSLTLWSGGRVQAQNRAAVSGRRTADIELVAQRAQLHLDVTEAYYDAVLADRLVAIAESSLVQTDGVLKQTRLARQVGNQSEFELLRAQVTHDNQLPVVLQRRTDRDLAYLRLKQLLNLPYGENVRLTTDIEEDVSTAAVRTVANTGTPTQSAMPDTSADARATVRQLSEALRAQQAQLSIAKSEYLPTVSLSTQYGRVGYTAGGVPTWSNFLNNWTVALGATFPLFTGGRVKGEQLIARAGVDEARARLEQTKELAALDARQTAAQLQQAEAAMAASAGTAGQALKAYNIAEVRYREGISTQLELADSRLLLEQAGANRAMAARNLQVARTRLLLLKDLPLGAGSAGFGGSNAGAAGGINGGSSIAPGGAGGAQGGGATQLPQGARTAATSTSTGPGQ